VRTKKMGCRRSLLAKTSFAIGTCLAWWHVRPHQESSTSCVCWLNSCYYSLAGGRNILSPCPNISD